MNICVFGASSDRIEKVYFDAAYTLGVLIAQGGHRLVFGGGNEGLMGACARGVLSEGGRPLGVAPRFFDEPGILMKEECDFVFTETMSERKARMEAEAEAFVALPGGIGTYEEFFEALTLKQLGQHYKPMALLNTAGYYNVLDSLLRGTASRGFMSDSVLGLYALCASPADALTHITAPAHIPDHRTSLSSYSR